MAIAPSNSEAAPEETVARDYAPSSDDPLTEELGVGHEFDRFFPGAGWFIGVVTAVDEETDVLEVKFDRGDEPSACVSEEELKRLREEPEMGEVGFQFVKQFCGNLIIGGKIESVSSKNKFVCCFDDGDVHTYSKKAMTKMVIRKFPVARDMSELDSRRSTDNDLRECDRAMAGKSRGECGGESVDNGSNTDSDSEEETLEQLENKT